MFSSSSLCRISVLVETRSFVFGPEIDELSEIKAGSFLYIWLVIFVYWAN